MSIVMVETGCVTRIGDFTVGSTKNMDIKKSLHKVDESTRNTGIDRSHIIFIIPTKLWVNMKEAMDNAIEKSPQAVGLSNVTVKYGEWYIPFIYGQFWYEVEGNPVYEVEESR